MKIKKQVKNERQPFEFVSVSTAKNMLLFAGVDAASSTSHDTPSLVLSSDVCMVRRVTALVVSSWMSLLTPSTFIIDIAYGSKDFYKSAVTTLDDFFFKNHFDMDK